MFKPNNYVYIKLRSHSSPLELNSGIIILGAKHGIRNLHNEFDCDGFVPVQTSGRRNYVLAIVGTTLTILNRLY